MVHFIQNRRQFLLSGELNIDTTMALLSGVQMHIGRGPVEIMVASGGGRVEPTICLVNVLQSLRAEHILRTIGIGCVASAAVLVLASGSIGHRYMLEGSNLLIHENSFTFHEKVEKTTSEWEEWVAARRKRQNEFWGMMAKVSKLTIVDYQARIEGKGDVILSPVEAKHMGLIDHVVSALPDAFPPALPENRRAKNNSDSTGLSRSHEG